MSQSQLSRRLSFRIYHPLLAFIYTIIILMSFEYLGFFMVTKPSFAATIEGKIFSEAGNNPLENMNVVIADLYLDFYSSTATDSTGEYQFNGLPSGVYIVCVNTAQSGYIAEFYNDAPNYSLAENIELDEDQVVSDINFALSPGRSIKGRVARQDNGLPISGIMIVAIGIDNQPITGFFPSDREIPDYAGDILGLGKNRNFTFTDSNGIYDISGLSPGKYQVGTMNDPMVYSPYIQEWYEDADDQFTATLVPLGAETDLSGIDFALREGSSIAGTITDPNDSPIQGILIMAMPSSRIYYPGYGLYVPFAYSDPNGRYRIGGVAPGDYIVQADYGSGSGSPYNYYAQGTSVSVQSGQVIEEVDFVITSKEGGEISGRVTDLADDIPVQGISLSAMPANPSSSYYYQIPALSDSNGCYTLTGLKKGSYIIQIVSQPFPFLRSNLNKYILGEYYDGVFEYDKALPVFITSQEKVSGIDFTLVTGGSISGCITSAIDQSPIAGIYVTALPCPVSQSNGYGSYAPVVYYGNSIGVSDHEGRYTIKGLRSGSYQIFSNNTSSAFLAYNPFQMNQYLSKSYNYGECIMVTAPYDNPNINISLEIGGSISGLVTDVETESPLSGIQVQAELIKPKEDTSDMSGFGQYGSFDISGEFSSDMPVSADTDMFGHYTIKGLSPGEYQVVACDKRGRYCCSTYRVIQTEAGQSISNINFSLKMGGTISGTVVDESTGLPLADILMKAVHMDYNIFESYIIYYGFSGQSASSPFTMDFINSARTDQTGKYTITGLGEGKYRVIASDSRNIYFPGYPNDIYLSEYFDNIPLESKDYVFYTELSREIKITAPPDPVLEFKMRGNSEFELILEVGEGSGGSLSIVFQSAGNYIHQINNPYLRRVDGSIIVPLDWDIEDWEVYEEDLDDLIEELKPDFVLNSIDKITLKGNCYWLDYVKLTGSNLPEFIELFDYTDMPANHGWDNIYPQSTYIAMEDDLDSEDGVMRVTSGQAVVLTDSNNTITDCDFALSKAGAISGKVSDSASDDPLEGIEVVAYDYDRVEMVGSSFTDQEGNYRISGLGPGDYFLLARDSGWNYLDQYYDNIENPYTGYVLGSMAERDDDYHHYRSIIKKKDLALPVIQYDNHILEFELKTNGPFCLGITLVTTTSKTVRIDVVPGRWEGSYTILDDIIQVIQAPAGGGWFNSGVWNRYQIDLNDMLSTHMGLSIHYVKEITLKGNDYLLDYIKLTEEYKIDQYIDNFDYTGSPFDNGWTNLNAQTSMIETITDQETGLHVLKVLPYNILSLSAGQNLNARDFLLTRAACLCGKIMANPNQMPIAGIEVTALSEGRNHTYYATPVYEYGPQTSGRTNAMGEYCVKGLSPGEYRVMAKDTQSFFNNAFYKDISIEPDAYPTYISSFDVVRFEMPNRFYTRIYQDLSEKEFDNAQCSFQAIYRGIMKVCVEVETITGRDVTIVMTCGGLDDESKFLDPNTHIIVSVHSGNIYGGFYGSSEFYYSPPSFFTWFKSTKDLNALLISNYPNSMGELQKIKGVSISGNDYRIDFIKFVEDGEPDEVVDEFDYTDANDLPTDHGWINTYPDTTYLAMVEDKELERKVLAASASTPVGVSQGEVKDNVDFHLNPGARIEGTVTAADGDVPLADITIEARDFNALTSSFPDSSYSATTDSLGNYTLFLPCYEGESKDYLLTARDYMEHYGDTEYGQSISVTSGTIITGIDMSMNRASSISGQITALSDGRPLGYVLVQARVANECYPSCLDCSNVLNECCPPPEGCITYKVVKSTYTNSEGRYTLRNLPPGGYIICALYLTYIYYQETIGFYDDNSDYLDPSIILIPGQEINSIDIQLAWNLYFFSSGYSSPTDYYNYYVYGGYPAYGGGIFSPVSTVEGIIIIPQQGTLPPSQGFAFFAPSTSNPPIITSLPETTAIVDELYTYQVTLKDPNSLHDDTYLQLVYSPDGMYLDPNSGLIVWTPAAPQIGLNAITVGANSSTRGITRQEFTISVLGYKALGPCEGNYAASDWVIESGNGTLDCVEDQILKKEVLEAVTSEDNNLDFLVRFPAGEMSPQLTRPRRYLSFTISDIDIFRFMVHVHANGMDYSIIYSPTEGEISASEDTIHYPLGSIYQDGDWHVINRDLQEDIDPLGASIEYVKYFQIQGDYRLYDLKLGIEPFTDELVYLNLIPGLNLIGLSENIVKEFTDSFHLLEHLGGAAYTKRFSKYNTYLQSWQVQSPISGASEFEIKDYQGYCLYADDHIKMVFKDGKSIFDIRELASRLRPGLNLIHISKPSRHPYYVSELIKDIAVFTNIKVISIQKYRSPEGIWQDVYGFFNRPIKSDFQLKSSEGYLINIKP